MNEALRGLLGWPAVIGPFVVWPLMTASLAYVSVRLRARSLRRHAPADSAHWTEHARFAQVARGESRAMAMVVVVTGLTIGMMTWRGEDASWLGGLLVVAAGAAGVVAGYVGFLHAYPSLSPPRDVPGASARGFVWPALVFGFWVLIPLLIIPFTTRRFDAATWVALGSGVALFVAWAATALPAARALRLIVDPPASLLDATRTMAARMNVPFNELWVLRWHLPNAFALPIGRNIAVTDRLLSLLSPEELEGVLAHELSHLREGWPMTLARLGGPAAWCTLSAGLPVYGTYGSVGVVALLVLVVMLLVLLIKLSHRAEHAADHAAHAHADSPAYARALEKLYEAALLPAVTKREGAHPHLYDRMEAAGVTPDYPRPAPPPARLGRISGALLIVALMFSLLPALLFRAAGPRDGARGELLMLNALGPLDADDLLQAADEAGGRGDDAWREALLRAVGEYATSGLAED